MAEDAIELAEGAVQDGGRKTGIVKIIIFVILTIPVFVSIRCHSISSSPAFYL